jgi:hypothetical protein
MKCSLTVLSLLLISQAALAEGSLCSAQSGAQVPRVVELYTSEGCSSCPPADRWLSGVKPGGGVIAAAFHVDYWNGLGWKDRFASPAATERQQQGVGVNGSRYPYTPQFVVDGRDWRGSALPALAATPSRVQLTLTRSAPDRASLSASILPGAPARIELWWARLEDAHQSRVRAGENRGEILNHDHVVRDYARLPVWDPASGPRSWALSGTQPEAGHASRWLAVATEAGTGKVLGAVELGC